MFALTQRRANFIGTTPLWTVNAQQMFEITGVNSSLKTWQVDWIYNSPHLETHLFCNYFFKRQSRCLRVSGLIDFHSAYLPCHPSVFLSRYIWIIATGQGLRVCSRLIKPRPLQNTAGYIDSPDTQMLTLGWELIFYSLPRWATCLNGTSPKWDADQCMSGSQRQGRVSGERERYVWGAD